MEQEEPNQNQQLIEDTSHAAIGGRPAKTIVKSAADLNVSFDTTMGRILKTPDLILDPKDLNSNIGSESISREEGETQPLQNRKKSLQPVINQHDFLQDELEQDITPKHPEHSFLSQNFFLLTCITILFLALGAFCFVHYTSNSNEISLPPKSIPMFMNSNESISIEVKNESEHDIMETGKSKARTTALPEANLSMKSIYGSIDVLAECRRSCCDEFSDSCLKRDGQFLTCIGLSIVKNSHWGGCSFMDTEENSNVDMCIAHCHAAEFEDDDHFEACKLGCKLYEMEYSPGPPAQAQTVFSDGATVGSGLYLITHYHKTGSVVSHLVQSSIQLVTSINLITNLIIKKRQHDSDSLCPFFPVGHNTVPSLGVWPAPDIFCDLKDDFFPQEMPPKILHLVRNPFEMAVSGFLYHSQHPAPERWEADDLNQCESDLTVLSKASNITEIPLDDLRKTARLCREFYDSHNFKSYTEALRYWEKEDDVNSLLMEASRGISSACPNAGGDILRMAFNVLMLERSGIPTMTIPMQSWISNPRETILKGLRFLFEDQISETTREKIADVFLEQSAEERASYHGKRHITQNKVSRERRQELKKILHDHEVVGPILRRIQYIIQARMNKEGFIQSVL